MPHGGPGREQVDPRTGRAINPFTGQPYPFRTPLDFLQALGPGLAGGIRSGVQGIQGALGPLSTQFRQALSQGLGGLRGLQEPGVAPGPLGEGPANLQAILGQLPGGLAGFQEPGAQGDPFVGLAPIQNALAAPASAQPSNVGLPSPVGPPSPGGGLGGAFQGIPFPQAPQLTPPQVDIGKLFDPIMEQLKDPERIKGATKTGGLAQILGGAAAGAARGLRGPFGGGEVGAVLAGAGGGASAALTELRREEQGLEAQHQEAVQRMNVARVGVQSQKAGAEIDLARDVANTANTQAQLEYNRNVQESLLSRPEVQGLGGGLFLTTTFDPKTGRTTANLADPLAAERALELATRLEIAQARAGRGRDEPRILIDGKEVRRSSLAASATSQFRTPVEFESYELATRALSDTRIRAAFAREAADFADEAGTVFNLEEPDTEVFRYIYSKALTDPVFRQQLWAQLTRPVSQGE